MAPAVPVKTSIAALVLLLALTFFVLDLTSATVVLVVLFLCLLMVDLDVTTSARLVVFSPFPEILRSDVVVEEQQHEPDKVLELPALVIVTVDVASPVLSEILPPVLLLA